MVQGSSKHLVGGMLLAGDDGDVLPTHFEMRFVSPLWFPSKIKNKNANRQPSITCHHVAAADFSTTASILISGGY